MRSVVIHSFGHSPPCGSPFLAFSLVGVASIPPHGKVLHGLQTPCFLPSSTTHTDKRCCKTRWLFVAHQGVTRCGEPTATAEWKCCERQSWHCRLTRGHYNRGDKALRAVRGSVTSEPVGCCERADVGRRRRVMRPDACHAATRGGVGRGTSDRASWCYDHWHGELELAALGVATSYT